MDDLAERLCTQRVNHEFVKIIHTHAQTLSAELLEDDEDLKQRTKPMVIALSRVNGNHRTIESFKSVLRCMIETDGEFVLP